MCAKMEGSSYEGNQKAEAGDDGEVQHESQCDKHQRDLYFGDEHRPGLTTRVLLVENAVASITFYARWLLVFVAGILVTGVMNLMRK